MSVAALAPWRRRYLAPMLRFPIWARDQPDRMVFPSNADGTWEIYAWDRASGRRRRVTGRPVGTAHGRVDAGGRWIWWFDDETGSERGHWMVEPFDGAARAVRVEGLPLAYPTGIALGADLAIASLELDDGFEVYRCAGRSDVRRLWAGAASVAVCGISGDDRMFSVEHTERGDLRNPALRVHDADGRVVGERWEGEGSGLWCGDWSPVRCDPRTIVYHERGGLLRPAVWDVRRDAVEEIAVEWPGEVDASWYPDGTALLLRAEARGRSRLFRWADGELTAVETPAGMVSVARARPDGAVWFEWQDGATPFQVRDAAGVVLDAGGPAAPPGRAFLDFEVGDIHGFLAEPDGGRPHPTVFFVHGGPHELWADAFAPRVQAWVDHGFAAVLVNYRGSTGYGKAWRDAVMGNPGFTELEDLATVRAWACERGLADPGRIVLWGSSWGGYLCLLALGTQPELWSLGIAHAPVADLVAAYEEETEELRAFDRSLFGGTPDDLPDVYRERSPVTHVDRVRVPVLIVAGTSDSRCPLEQIERYTARLTERRPDCQLVRYDAGHVLLVGERVVHELETEIAFVARHLGTLSPR